MARDRTPSAARGRDHKPATTPQGAPRASAGRVARPSDDIEEEEMQEAQADGRIHQKAGAPSFVRGTRKAP